MQNSIKQTIVTSLKERIAARKISNEQAATQIGISGATISCITNRKWELNEKLVSEKMWNKVKNWLGLADEWVVVTTDRNFKRVNNICHQAQRKSHARAISAAPGTGKSEGLKHYARNNPNSFYIECGDYWTKKTFLTKVKAAMGLKPIHLQGIPEMVEEIISALRKMTRPLLIIDEADKLKDNTLTFFITFYNELSGTCGFVLSGSEFFEKHIDKFSRLNKKGYREIYSRFGGEFLHLYELTEERTRDIITANGIDDEEAIMTIINKSGGDIRVVQRLVEDAKLLSQKQTAR